MISLKDKQTIIQLYLEGMSERAITKKVSKARNTVRKYIREFNESKVEDVRDLPITEHVLAKPIYKKRKGEKRALTPEIQRKLIGFIKDNEWKKQHGFRKQMMKIVDMHKSLLDQGHVIGYTTIRNFVNKEVQKKKEVFIRRHHLPGAAVEFDWGEVKLIIDGELKKLSTAIFTLPYSNLRFARLYESETMVCLLDVHVAFIDTMGFIPETFIYDNMRTVVKKFIGYEKEITDSMQHLANYYGFNIRLCEPRKGNEKGHVERSVDFIRRKAFSSNHTFINLEEAERHLEQVLGKLNQRNHHVHHIPHIILMEEEKSIASPAIASFNVAELVELRVDKYSTVVINQNHYSVPEGHVGEYIKVKVGAKQIKLFIEGELVATHRRNWGLHQWIMDIHHYLDTFKKKKGAISQSEALRQAPTKVKNIFKTYYTGKERGFI